MPASPTWGDLRLGLRNGEDCLPVQVPAYALGQYFWTLRQGEDSLQGNADFPLCYELTQLLQHLSGGLTPVRSARETSGAQHLFICSSGRRQDDGRRGQKFKQRNNSQPVSDEVDEGINALRADSPHLPCEGFRGVMVHRV